MPGMYVGFGNHVVMPSMLHNPFNFPRPYSGIGLMTPFHGSRKK